MKNELSGPTAIIAIVVVVVLVLAAGFMFMNRSKTPTSGKGSGAAVESKPYIPPGATVPGGASGGSAGAAHND